VSVCVVGTGYVGLVTGACLAELGHQITCHDIDDEKIDGLNCGKIQIFEPGLKEIVARNVAAGRLTFSSKLETAAARGSDVYFIAVGTPSRKVDGRADLTAVYAVADAIGRAVAKANRVDERCIVVVTKSTVPVGTCSVVERILGKHLGPGLFAVASNPEFLREGNAVRDFLSPDRIVVGSCSSEAHTVLENLYRPLLSGGVSLLASPTPETAELIKYASNAFLATKIGFINELSQLCEKVGIDIDLLAKGMGLDKRIGDKFLRAGPGYGGSCFPKDTLAIAKTARDFGCRLGIIEAAIRANENQKHFVVEKIRAALGNNISGSKIAVLGLSFKAMTDDIRESPALFAIPMLAQEGAEVRAYDPVASANAGRILGNGCVYYPRTLVDAVTGADLAVILTEWEEFRRADWGLLAGLMTRRILIDFRNLITAEQAKAFNLDYFPLGRPASAQRPVRADESGNSTRNATILEARL
jgi:UDPglucose 6-dehydrogenase